MGIKKPYKVVFKASCKEHEEKRPTMTHEFITVRDMADFLLKRLIISDYQMSSTLEEYNIILKKEIQESYYCKSCGMDLTDFKEVYEENKLCNACDNAVHYIKFKI